MSVKCLQDWAQGGRMEGVDESTELWRQPCTNLSDGKLKRRRLIMWQKPCVNMYQLLSVESAIYFISLITRICASNWREDRIKCRLVVGTASLTVLLLRHLWKLIAQWLWVSWQSSHFWCQESAVRSQSTAKKYHEHIYCWLSSCEGTVFASNCW